MIMSLQYLRAIAAMMVVAFHAVEYIERIAGTAPTLGFDVGLSGVDIFFVLSGFIIQQTSEGRNVSPLAFLWRRALRIVPLYWMLTLLVANVAILRPDLMATTVYDGTALLASLFFIPSMHPVLHQAVPLLVPGWTLNYEMAFYALFALSLALPPRWRLGAVLGIMVAAVALRHVIPYSTAGAFYTMPLILEFGAGMVIARVYAAGVRLRRAISILLVVVGFFALLAMAGTGLWRSFASGLPAAMIVAGAVFYERSGGLPYSSLLRRLGDASFSIYLSHVLTLPVLAKVWMQLVPATGFAVTPAGEALFMALALLLSATAGLLVYMLVERPLLMAIKGRPPTPKSRPSDLGRLEMPQAAMPYRA